jgi:mono/diheme cytochrome c family protein
MQAPPRKPLPPPGVVFDTSLDTIDQVLALSMLFGFESARQARIPSLSTSRSSLPAATFLDVVARFFDGEQPGRAFVSRSPLPIGMPDAGPPHDHVPPMLAAVLDKADGNGRPVYTRHITQVNETADPVAQIRNGLSAQLDGNAAVILAGLSANLVALLGRPDGREWAGRKARVLCVAAGRFDPGPADPLVAADVPGFRTLLAEWPTPIVLGGLELDDTLRFPGTSVDTSFEWAAHHPVADAYRAAGRMPYDASARACAAVLHAVNPEDGAFTLSEPGEITVLDDGRTQFTASPTGRHRYLVARPDQKERILQTYVQLASAQPPPPPGRPTAPPAAPPAARSGARAATLVAAVVCLVSLTVGRPAPLLGQAGEFDTAVRPILQGTCAQCHNERLLSGDLDVAPLISPDSLARERETWERVLRRLRVGDMPPPGVARPDEAQLSAMVGHIERAFERTDAATPPDPGRMTAHRLNRNEYTNTIRDLLGVRFRAERYFPADDSGDGFDNMGELLTVSPLLMERYVAAAEQIAGWALSTAMPPKPIEAAYRARDRRIRRVDRSTIEAEGRIEFAGEYIVRFGLPGERPTVDGRDAAPVTLGFFVNGELLASTPVETKPSGLVYFDPYSEEELRVYLTEGDHVFRAAFVGDGFAASLSDRDAYDRRKNKFLDSIVFEGPFPSSTQKPSRARILSCDPASGRACQERILSALAQRAYRRPVTSGDVASLLRFVDMAVADGQTAEEGIQLALQAMLVSPHFLFRIERDPDPRDPTRVHDVSPFELASRLSYFLWSSMPDEELFALAESGRLRDTRVLDAQVERMLADPRASALAENFAGQWLETRNLDVVKPDPDLFKEWSPELRDAMKAETTLFFEHVLRENRPVSDFLNADYTFLNERLARHYGIAGVTGDEFRRVALTTDRRGGVLSQASVLTVSSYPTRTSPVIRGKYVLQNILGIPPAPPPPDVPSLDAEGVGEKVSMREQLEQHRRNPTCASCHRAMDPLGFGLENYDAIGRWRDVDGKFPVDAAGTLPNGQRFTSGPEMRALLASQLPQFSRTLIERMMTYALRRGLQTYDRRTVESIHRALAADDYRFRTLVLEIVKSVPFQARRGEELARTR